MSHLEDHHGNGQSFDSPELVELERWASERGGQPPLPLRDWLALAEAWRIARALRDNRGNRSATARALGIGRRTLYTKMEKLGLVPSWSASASGKSAAASPENDPPAASSAISEG